MVTRIPSCELQYGPFDCDLLKRSPDQKALDSKRLPEAVHCNVNFPSPDLMVPSRMGEFIWSWAPGQPPAEARGAAGAAGGDVFLSSPNAGGAIGRGGGKPPAWCAVFYASDGRWRTEEAPCATRRPIACRGEEDPNMWALAPAAPAAKATCPSGWRFAVPSNAYQNRVLMNEVRAVGQVSAWLPMYGGPEGGLPVALLGG
mmetsp:Transcript_25527/g.80852  ORF Transcript_25527/g.80852 Transcript_25527/m.80852 type:complete len:201 (+) Transcript_25527:128-730(+)